MKLFKAGALVTLAAVLSLACSSPAGENKNGATNQPVTQPANANLSQGMVVLPSNANASAPSGPSNANRAVPGSKPASTINAAGLYVAQKCTGCHGTNGKPKVKGAPDFTDAAWQQKETDAKLVEAIKKGNVPKMPAYGSKLTEDEIRALVAYVRTFSGK